MRNKREAREGERLALGKDGHNMQQVSTLFLLLIVLRDGWPHRTDELLGKLERSLIPPHFWKIVLHFFHNFMLKKPCLKVQNLQREFLD